MIFCFIRREKWKLSPWSRVKSLTVTITLFLHQNSSWITVEPKYNVGKCNRRQGKKLKIILQKLTESQVHVSNHPISRKFDFLLHGTNLSVGYILLYCAIHFCANASRNETAEKLRPTSENRTQRKSVICVFKNLARLQKIRNYSTNLDLKPTLPRHVLAAFIYVIALSNKYCCEPAIRSKWNNRTNRQHESSKESISSVITCRHKSARRSTPPFQGIELRP